MFRLAYMTHDSVISYYLKFDSNDKPFPSEKRFCEIKFDYIISDYKQQPYLLYTITQFLFKF